MFKKQKQFNGVFGENLMSFQSIYLSNKIISFGYIATKKLK